MLLISQNLTKYDLKFPKDTVLRVNLAWIFDLEALEDLVSKYDNDIFLDMPLGRKKPPSNFYTVDQLKPIITNNPQIKYIAISNVVAFGKPKKVLGPFVTALQPTTME